MSATTGAQSILFEDLEDYINLRDDIENDFSLLFFSNNVDCHQSQFGLSSTNG